MLNRSIFKIRVLVTGDDVCCFIKKLLLKEDEGTIRNQSENGGVFTQTWKFAAAQMGLCHVIFIMFVTFTLMKGQNPKQLQILVLYLASTSSVGFSSSGVQTIGG